MTVVAAPLVTAYGPAGEALQVTEDAFYAVYRDKGFSLDPQAAQPKVLRLEVPVPAGADLSDEADIEVVAQLAADAARRAVAEVTPSDAPPRDASGGQPPAAPLGPGSDLDLLTHGDADIVRAWLADTSITRITAALEAAEGSAPGTRIHLAKALLGFERDRGDDARTTLIDRLEAVVAHEEENANG